MGSASVEDIKAMGNVQVLQPGDAVKPAGAVGSPAGLTCKLPIGSNRHSCSKGVYMSWCLAVSCHSIQCYDVMSCC